ncbi:MAG: protein kinase [Fibrobacteres bacterium]|nr:protein kinase [Fibrobacterota bacterium]
MIRKSVAIALGVAIPLLGGLALGTGLLPSELLYETVLQLMGPTQRTEREGASPVLLVDIDNAAQDARGPWPWPAERLDSLLLLIAKSGARAVVVDASFFADPVHRPSTSLWSLLPGGVPFVLPVQTHGGNPKACPLWNTLVSGEEKGFRRVGSTGLPVGVPCDERFVGGLDSLVENHTGLSTALLWNDGRNLIPSTAVSALLVSAPNSAMSGNWWDPTRMQVVSSQGGATVDSRGEILLRPLGAPGQGIPRVNAATVLSSAGGESLFRGRIVVVGVTATGLVPTLEVPFSAAMAGKRMPRAEVTATVLLNLLERSSFHLPFWAWIVPWLGSLSAAALAWFGLRQARRRWTLLAQSFLGVALVVVWWMLVRLDQWITPLSFLLPVAGTFLLVLLWPRQAKLPPRPIAPQPLAPRPTQRMFTDSSGRQPSSAQASTISALDIPSEASVPEGSVQRGLDGDLVRLGRYADLRPIGAGGMCKVYVGHDPVMDRPVAIKILRTDKAKGQTTEQRFLREARIAGSLHHPNINTVFDFGQADDLLYLVLEYVDGETLSQWIKEHNGVRPKAVVAWVRQIGEALDAAHSAQVVHRDVKPSNFMIVRQTGAIKLMDFGVARTPDVTLTQAGTTVGTPNYMSPEQLQGSKVGPASDLYSFGVVLYQILTQRMPFHGEGLTALCSAILKGQCTKLSTHRPDLAGPVEQVVHKAFSVRSEDRYLSGVEFAEAFEKAAST